MKKFIKLAFIAFTTICLVACEKERIEPINNVIDPTDEENNGILESATLISSVPATKAGEELSKVLISDEYQPSKTNLTKEILDLLNVNYDESKLEGFGPQLVTWRINYETKGGYKGKEKITLTADVCYVTNKNKEDAFENVSLIHGMFNIAEGDLATSQSMLVPLRALLHNDVVVFPWYQGTQADRDKHVVTPGEFILRGQQAIDAERAAIELIRGLEGENQGSILKEGFITKNMGISNGGGPALATQYLLENVKPYKDYNNSLRLAETYVGEGCTSFAKVFPRIIEDALNKEREIDEMYEGIMDASYLATIVSTYYTHIINPEDDKSILTDSQYNTEIPQYTEYIDKTKLSKKKSKSPYVDNYNAMLSFFSTDFKNKEYDSVDNVTSETETCPNMIYAFRYGKLYMGAQGDFSDPETMEYNYRLDQMVPESIEQTKIDGLLQYYNDIDAKLLHGWDPVSPLYIKHSEDDDFIIFKDVKEYYDELSNNGTNKNVVLETVSGLDHGVGSTLCCLEVVLKDDPCPINNNDKHLLK